MLSWSISLFRVCGIRLAVHWTFSLLIGYAAWVGWTSADEHWLGAAVNVVLVGVFFTFVILHEFGHAFMARRFGVKVPRILLLPIGGMAEFDSIPRQPGRELLIALAGPAVNFTVVGLLLFFVPFPGHAAFRYLSFTHGGAGLFYHELLREWGEIDLSAREGILQGLMLMNLLMGCFNLAPVFPMDGGRVLRAVLASKLPYLQATQLAATIGKVLAAAGVFVAAFYLRNPQIAALFTFIFIAGEIEFRAVRRREREMEYWRDTVERVYGTRPAPDSILES